MRWLRVGVICLLLSLFPFWVLTFAASSYFINNRVRLLLKEVPSHWASGQKWVNHLNTKYSLDFIRSQLHKNKSFSFWKCAWNINLCSNMSHRFHLHDIWKKCLQILALNIDTSCQNCIYIGANVKIRQCYNYLDGKTRRE